MINDGDGAGWQPSASWSMLEQRAQLNRRIRQFFEDRGVLEVEVPLLSPYTVTDVQLEPLQLASTPPQYLQTSPEYYLKRLISAHSRCVYSLAKAFRQDESGSRHRAEFTLLEWYRMGFDDQDLMAEVEALCSALQPGVTCAQISYQQLFLEHLQVDPHCVPTPELATLGRTRTTFDGELNARSDWLDLLFSFCIEPHLNRGVTLVYDYPVCQSALARLGPSATGEQVAKRFEVFWNGIEIGNGYWELTSSELQRARFEEDNRQRAGYGKSTREIDPRFMAALASGMPECSGIAIGLDRLLMCLTDSPDIRAVISFADQ